MLSIINAAEVQFRHEFETRERELALLASIRERRAAEATIALSRVASEPRVAPIPEEPRRTAVRTTRAAWPRPIGVKNCETTVCATA